MWKASAWSPPLLVLLAASALAQIPWGYEIVTLSQSPPDHYTARMNNCGQVVFDLWKDGGNDDAIDIMLYDNGRYIRLTDDDVYDRQPDINDAGTIVWSRAVHGPGTHPQIVIYRDGVLTQLTDTLFEELSPRINNHGHVVWSRWTNQGCGGASADIYFYDGQTIRQITNDDWSNQGAVINDDDWIAWTQYDFCQNPWQSKTMLWVNGVATQLSPVDAYAPVAPSINNLGQVVCMARDAAGAPMLQRWAGGAVTTLTTWGGAPCLNNRGDIAFWRYYPGTPIGSYEVWLYRSGRFIQISNDPHGQGWNNIWNYPTDINDRGEIAFYSGRPWYDESTIKWMRLKVHTSAAVQVAP